MPLHVVLATVLAVSGLTVAIPAQAGSDAGPAPSTWAMPSAVPAARTPAVDNGRVQAIAQVGSTMVIGGTFSSVSSQARQYVAAFNVSTNTLTSFNPTLDGAVTAVLPGPVADTVYVAGSFRTVNGATRRGITLLSLTTGQQVAGFAPPTLNNLVNDIVVRGNQLYLAGVFTKVGTATRGGLARLNATTGALDQTFVVNLAEHHNNTGGGAQAAVGATAIAVTPDNTRMVVIGNFRTANGLPRVQAAMIDVAASPAVVRSDWATSGYVPQCFNWAFDTYMRGIAMSPDGSYFVITSTGGPNGGTLCDSAARWETAATGSDVRPTWVTETGGDTLWATAITANAVFIGGHQRWLNNPNGGDSAQAGAVPRAGLAALDPVSGRPMAWNPGRNPRGVAVYAFLATSTGLWVGSDTTYIGNRQYLRKRLAFFPYAGGIAQTPRTTPSLPASVYVGTAPSDPSILYRVNAGGSVVGATDIGSNWSDDSGPANPLRNSGSNAAGWGGAPNYDPTMPAHVPTGVFGSERWDPWDATEMSWHFPVAAGTPVQVRLFFADRCGCTSTPGSRVFNVSVDGTALLTNFDINAAVGHDVATMRTTDLVSDGSVDIDFGHVVENPLVNAIEIVRTDLPPPPPSDGTLSAAPFDGTTAGPLAQVSDGGIAWKDVRGAFTVGGKLFYGMTDAKLHVASFTGGTIGASSIVQPYHDPAWMNVSTGSGQTYDGAEPSLYGQLPSVSGMTYADGRLYYTLAGDNALYFRWFSPDSGIMDERTFTVPSTVGFADADGMFADGGWLYVASSSTGTLSRVAFSGTGVTGSFEVVDAPGTGGNDWRNRALFLG
ncbi:MAG: malectin domain-containing carbohydrate-binding protein [Candidatus Lutibacillus vidarii]